MNRSLIENNFSFAELLKKYVFPLWKQLSLLVVLSLITSFFTTIQPILISGLLEITMGEPSVQETTIQNVLNETPYCFFYSRV